MSIETCFHNATLYTGCSTMRNCAVHIKHHKIIDVFNETRFKQKQFNDYVEFIDLKGAYIAPGFIDTHIHGIGGFGTDDMNEDSILKMSEILPRYGVTSFIPTLYSAPKGNLFRAMISVLKAMGHERGAKILGMHLEGPFISPERLGVQSLASISAVDLEYMKEIISLGGGNIVNMTVAPELKGMRELALMCIDQGIILQAGHTNANYQQMVEAMQARIMHVTHLFNAMSRMHHRDPGVVGAVFIHPELSCEIIADGVHINPEIIKFLFNCKPTDKVVLVTDSLKPTKQRARHLYANGEEVYFDKCFMRKSDNVIAGSGLTMIEGVKNLVDFGLDIEQAVQTASYNPAMIMKQDHLGFVAPGYDADLVVFDKNFKLLKTVIKGEIFEKGIIK
ncbi:MAG: N-acetylglucosamine-6-phosphate deacetylase [Alphaproteobacteria bacterium]|nr:N-acetylglucosamine-6-phosphate deacetylase [Alphaproteobacteria bacterium]